MPVKTYKPTTAGRRSMTTQDFEGITTKKPLKSLLLHKKQKSGRNNQGRITTRHRGGGAKRFIRIVNFSLPEGTSAIVEHIEYDPGRSARIARIKDQNNKYHYILAEKSMRVGEAIKSGKDASVSEGNRLPLSEIPLGSSVYAVEIQPNKGSQMVRSAGSYAQLMAKENGYAQLKLPSGEIRKFLLDCYASIGVVSNVQHQNIKIGKAGRNRHRGIRPSVRGVVMNAVDHPHGGGDGGRHSVGGGRNHGTAPRTPWGVKTLGFKTRKRKSTDKLIVRNRHQAKRRKK